MDSELHFLEGVARAFAADVEETRTVEFVISSGTRDRKRTVMNMNNWKLEAYNRNGVVGYQHNLYGDLCVPPNPDDVIGMGRAWIEGDHLIGSVRFEEADLNPVAEKIFRKVLAGTLRATSVGILPLSNEKGERGVYGEGEEAKGAPQETFYFHGQELIEFSIVNIPANPDAVRRSMRDQSARAMLYLRRQTGLSLAEIEALTVRDLLQALDGSGFESLRKQEEEAEVAQPEEAAVVVEALAEAAEAEPEASVIETLAEAAGDPLLGYRLRQRRAELGL